MSDVVIVGISNRIHKTVGVGRTIDVNERLDNTDVIFYENGKNNRMYSDKNFIRYRDEV